MITKIKVVKNKEKPEPINILAEAIIKIGNNFEALSQSGLNREAIIILIHDHSKVSKRDISIVLENLRLMKGWYCR